MSEKVAKRSIDEYFKIINANHAEEAYINFGGGEPLLNYKTIEKLLPYIDEYRKKLSIPVKIGLNTNLALLTKEMAKTFIKYDAIVAASQDQSERSGRNEPLCPCQKRGRESVLIRIQYSRRTRTTTQELRDDGY